MSVDRTSTLDEIHSAAGSTQRSISSDNHEDSEDQSYGNDAEDDDFYSDEGFDDITRSISDAP
jgi:hypothetical protein